MLKNELHKIKKKYDDVDESNKQAKASKLTKNINDTLAVKEDVHRHCGVTGVPNLLLEISMLKDKLLATDLDNERARALVAEQRNRINLLQPMYYRLVNVGLLFGIQVPQDEDDRRWCRMMQKKYDALAEKRDAIIYTTEMQAKNHQV